LTTSLRFYSFIVWRFVYITVLFLAFYVFNQFELALAAFSCWLLACFDQAGLRLLVVEHVDDVDLRFLDHGVLVGCQRGRLAFAFIRVSFSKTKSGSWSLCVKHFDFGIYLGVLVAELGLLLLSLSGVGIRLLAKVCIFRDFIILTSF
jgi:hypothetical protein